MEFAMKARISAVDYFLPETVLTNADLTQQFPEWSVEKISSKTGISIRHISGEDEFSSDLATAAARALFRSSGIDPATIDYLIVCTQSPDYYLPTTACIVQDALGLSTRTGATDVALGCSGYIYSLGLAKGLIESGQVSSVLVLTADTYTKFINPADKSVRTIFGDGAAATLVTAYDGPETLRAFVYGTDGSGAGNLIVPSGGLRRGQGISPKSDVRERALDRSQYDLFMDGSEIFNFTLETVPGALDEVLKKAELSMDEIDLYVFHQANSFMLEHLRKKIGIPAERFFVSLAESGNTVSSTIPIALADAQRQGVLKSGMKVMLLGFGVGLSWAGAVVDW
jgi:3-oxoacyl-[acyl-carrier-protein] synthase-3